MTYLAFPSLASSNTNKTDLGHNGNSYVLERHGEFLKKNQTCTPQNEETYRVLIQGFSLFSGVDMNISGAVVDTFAGLPLKKRSLLEDNDFGSRVQQTVIEISGKKVELCLVVSEVLWDLAAANLISVVKDFKPDFILMSGRGGKKATIETGARNQASTLAGYTYNGTYSGSVNRPHSRRVDGRYKSKKIIPATWNFEKIYSEVRPLVNDMNHEIELGKEGRGDNDYICNNIHYSLLQSTLEGDVELAGGLLRPQMNLDIKPPMGFFHYPSKTLRGDREKELLQWKEVIVKLISAQLNL